MVVTIYKCEYCDKSFNRKLNLARHYERKQKCYDINKIRVVKMKQNTTQNNNGVLPENETQIETAKTTQIDIPTENITIDNEQQNETHNSTQTDTPTENSGIIPENETQNKTENTTQNDTPTNNIPILQANEPQNDTHISTQNDTPNDNIPISQENEPPNETYNFTQNHTPAENISIDNETPIEQVNNINIVDTKPKVMGLFHNSIEYFNKLSNNGKNKTSKRIKNTNSRRKQIVMCMSNRKRKKILQQRITPNITETKRNYKKTIKMKINI